MKVTLARDVELGKCQEMSGIIHVVGEKGETHDRPLCNQGAIKFAVGKNPTTLKFPATGDVSQIEVKGVGAVCSKCLKVMQSEEAARRAPVEAPATKKPDPPPVINAVEEDRGAQGQLPRRQDRLRGLQQEGALSGPRREGGGSPGRAPGLRRGAGPRDRRAR